MDYLAFLDKVIDDGIKAAKADYVKPSDKPRLEGSIVGFEMCRGKNPDDLVKLMLEVHREMSNWWIKGEKDDIDKYWYINSKQAEIEWVANVVSAALVNQGLAPIVIPTARGLMKAAEVINNYSGKEVS